MDLMDVMNSQGRDFSCESPPGFVQGSHERGWKNGYIERLFDLFVFVDIS